MTKQRSRATLVLISSLSCAQGRDNFPRTPWMLPPVARQNREYLEECESLVAFLEQLRGGSDRGYYQDDYNRRATGYYRDDDRYDDRFGDHADDYPNERRRRYEDDPYFQDEDRGRKNGSSPFESMPSVIKNGNRQIGLALLGSGTVITMLGMSLFFNKTLMRLGNLLFIAGVPMTVGPSRTASYFLKPEKIRATACLGLGIFLVFIGMPIFGISLEVFGLLNLFGNMFPVILAIAKNMPVIGPILSGNHSSNQRPSRADYDQKYYDDPHYEDSRENDREEEYSQRYY